MVTFIAYFDILGFKEFITNNDKAYVDQHLRHLYRESQNAICGGHHVPGPPPSLLPDFNFAEVNCLHISDSILFWTEDASAEDFLKIVEVCYLFLGISLQVSFPLRGCLVAGDIEYKPFQITNNKQKRFDNNIFYGSGLVDAYEKAESQDWAGCYIDQSVFDLKAKDTDGNDTKDPLISQQAISDLIYSHRLLYYPVPFKDGGQSYQLAIRTISGSLNNVGFLNISKGIERTFNRHMNGRELAPGVKRKLFNTIKFLESIHMSNQEIEGSGKKSD